jgi:hypothetical protein
VRRFRLLTATALAAGTLLAGPASAAKLPCAVLKDSANDAGWANNAGGATLADPSLDIVSADVASDGKTLTAVIRVKQLTQTDNLAPTGRSWGISMAAGTSPLGLNAFLSPFGERFSTGKGKFDYAKNEIRIHIALADVPFFKVKKGTILRNLNVTTSTYVGYPKEADAVHLGAGIGAPGGNADTAQNPKAYYKVGTLNCVKLGK